VLDAALCAYFAGFQQIISYIYDPDGLFESRVRRAGVRNLISASPKIDGIEHAACQLARPLRQLAVWLDDPAAHIFPSAQDLSQAQTILSALPQPYVAIHPGSGSEKKNWPLLRWLEVQRKMLDDTRVGHLLIVGGESDSRQLSRMKLAEPAERQTILESLSLPVLGAVLSQCALFAGRQRNFHPQRRRNPCLLLFGPTNSRCLGARPAMPWSWSGRRMDSFEFGNAYRSRQNGGTVPQCPTKRSSPLTRRYAQLATPCS
jgi:hypothetical protein